MHKKTLIFFLFSLLVAPLAHAQSTSIHVNEETLKRGFTVVSHDRQVKLGILPGILNQPARVSIHDVTKFVEPAPGQHNAQVYEYSIYPPNALIKNLPIVINANSEATVKMRPMHSSSWATIHKTEHEDYRAKTSFSKGIISISNTVKPTVLGASTKASTIGSNISYVVADAHSGKLISSKNAYTKRPIASLTKLMTALVFLDTKTNWNNQIMFQKSDFVGGASLWVKPGDVVSVKDLFFSTLVGSHNNSAKALVRATGLTEAQFVARMNAKARSLGLNQTRFVEPTGLSEYNVSTAAEYIRLAKYALQRFEMLQGTTTKNYTVRLKNRPVKYTVKNTNKLLNSDLYITGGKTGYTHEAGYNLMTKSKYNGKEVIAVVMGASQGEHFKLTEQLLRDALAKLNQVSAAIYE